MPKKKAQPISMPSTQQSLHDMWGSKQKTVWVKLSAPLLSGPVNQGTILSWISNRRYGYMATEPQALYVQFPDDDAARKFQQDLKWGFQSSIVEEPNEKHPAWVSGRLCPDGHNIATCHLLLKIKPPNPLPESLSDDKTRREAFQSFVSSARKALPNGCTVLPIVSSPYMLVSFDVSNELDVANVVPVIEGCCQPYTVEIVRTDSCATPSYLTVHLQPRGQDKSDARSAQLLKINLALFGHLPTVKTSLQDKEILVDAEDFHQLSRIAHFWSNGPSVSAGDVRVWITFNPGINVEKIAEEEPNSASTTEAGSNHGRDHASASTPQVSLPQSPIVIKRTPVQGHGRFDTYALELAPLQEMEQSTRDQLYITAIENLKRWYKSHGGTLKGEPEGYAKQLPRFHHIIAALQPSATGEVDPYALARACNSGQNIGPTDEAFYYLTITGPKVQAMKGLRKIAERDGEQRDRIVEANEKALVGKNDTDWVTAVYVGHTTYVEDRNDVDMLNLLAEEGEADIRSPLSIMEEIAGGVTGIDDFCFITFSNGVPLLHGTKAALANGRTPPVARIVAAAPKHIDKEYVPQMEGFLAGVVGDEVLNVKEGGEHRHKIEPDFVNRVKAVVTPDCHKHALVIGGSTGKKGQPLADCKSGRVIAKMFQDYQRGDSDAGEADFDQVQNFQFREALWHPQIGHESNDPVVTEEEVAQMIESIQDDDHLLVLLGTTDSIPNFNKHLLPDNPLDPNALMSMKLCRAKGRDRIVFLVPHFGIMNYVGEDVEWINKSYSRVVAAISIIGSLIEKSDMSTKTIRDIYEEAMQMPLMQEILSTLSETSSNSFWNGNIAPKLRRFLQAGCSPEQALLALRDQRGLGTVTTLRKPENFAKATATIIPADTGTKADAWISVWVPAGGRFKTKTLFRILVEKRFRKSYAQYGYLYLDEPTLELRFMLLNGSPLMTNDGEVWAYNRIQWMTMAMLGAAERVVERFARDMRVMRPLSIYESREIAFINGGRNRYNTRIFSCLDFNQAKHEVETGGLRSYPVMKKPILHFFDSTMPSEDAYVLVGPETNKWFQLRTSLAAYESAEFSNTLVCDKGSWAMAVFERNARTEWNVRFTKLVKLPTWAFRNAEGWLQTHAQDTDLFKIYVGLISEKVVDGGNEVRTAVTSVGVQGMLDPESDEEGEENGDSQHQPSKRRKLNDGSVGH